jgi:hypothetical protein
MNSNIERAMAFLFNKIRILATQGKFWCLLLPWYLELGCIVFFLNKLVCIVVDLGFICLASFFRTRIYSKFIFLASLFCHVYIVVDLGFYSHEIF